MLSELLERRAQYWESNAIKFIEKQRHTRLTINGAVRAVATITSQSNLAKNISAFLMSVRFWVEMPDMSACLVVRPASSSP